MSDGHDHHASPPAPPAATPARRVPVGLVLVVVGLVLVVAVPLAWYRTADHGRFDAAPDPCPLLAARAEAALGPKTRVQPSTASAPSPAGRRCDASADPTRDDAPGVSLEAVHWRSPTFSRDLAGVSAGVRAMAGSDTVPVAGLGDDAYAQPGLGWLTVRVSNLSLRFTANVDLLVIREPDAIQALLQQLAAGALEHLAT
jgi:hypothetical protein